MRAPTFIVPDWVNLSDVTDTMQQVLTARSLSDVTDKMQQVLTARSINSTTIRRPSGNSRRGSGNGSGRSGYDGASVDNYVVHNNSNDNVHSSYSPSPRCLVEAQVLVKEYSAEHSVGRSTTNDSVHRVKVNREDAEHEDKKRPTRFVNIFLQIAFSVFSYFVAFSLLSCQTFIREFGDFYLLLRNRSIKKIKRSKSREKKSSSLLPTK